MKTDKELLILEVESEINRLEAEIIDLMRSNDLDKAEKSYSLFQETIELKGKLYKLKENKTKFSFKL